MPFRGFCLFVIPIFLCMESVVLADMGPDPCNSLPSTSSPYHLQVSQEGKNVRISWRELPGSGDYDLAAQERVIFKHNACSDVFLFEGPIGGLYTGSGIDEAIQNCIDYGGYDSEWEDGGPNPVYNEYSFVEDWADVGSTRYHLFERRHWSTDDADHLMAVSSKKLCVKDKGQGGFRYCETCDEGACSYIAGNSKGNSLSVWLLAIGCLGLVIFRRTRGVSKKRNRGR